MKAVVVEIKKHYAAVLSDDGSVKTVKNNNYEIGQIIQLIDRKVSYTKKLITIAASAAAFIFLSVGTWAYASPYLYVSVDVNPSIEYTVNRFDRVLTAKAVNDDGEEVIDKITLRNLKNKKIEAAITETVNQITKAGYFNGNTEGGIVITTASENAEKADELADTLQAITEQEISEDTTQEVDIETYSVGLDRVEEARELGVTPGKLNLVEKLQAAAENSADINLEEWLNKPVKDIMKATKEYKTAAAASSSDISVKEKDQKKNENKEEKLQNEKDKASIKEDKAQNSLEKDKTDKSDQGKQSTSDQGNTDNRSKLKIDDQSKQKSNAQSKQKSSDQGKQKSNDQGKQKFNDQGTSVAEIDKSETLEKADASSKRTITKPSISNEIKETVTDNTSTSAKESNDKATLKTDESLDNSNNQESKKSNLNKENAGLVNQAGASLPKSDTNPSRDSLPQDTTPEPSDNSVSQEHSAKTNPDSSNKSDTAVNQSDNSSSQFDNAAKQSVPFVDEPESSVKQSTDESDKKGNTGNDFQGSEQGSGPKDH